MRTLRCGQGLGRRWVQPHAALAPPPAQLLAHRLEHPHRPPGAGIGPRRAHVDKDQLRQRWPAPAGRGVGVHRRLELRAQAALVLLVVVGGYLRPRHAADPLVSAEHGTAQHARGAAGDPDDCNMAREPVQLQLQRGSPAPICAASQRGPAPAPAAHMGVGTRSRCWPHTAVASAGEGRWRAGTCPGGGTRACGRAPN